MAFPTETVYGLGARVFDAQALDRIFEAKGRPGDNPLIVHIADYTQLERVAARVPQKARLLMKKFWPGPLTLVLRKTREVPARATAGLPTVGVRMPSHPVARRLIRALGEPIAAPSANISGRPSSTTFQDARRELKGKADMILKGGASRIGLESTVLDCTRRPFQILRPGFVTLEDLKKWVSVQAPSFRRLQAGPAASPGLKHKHYRPRYPVIAMPAEYLNAEAGSLMKRGFRIGVLLFRARVLPNSMMIYRKDFKGNMKKYARELYASFLQAERAGVDALVVESVAKSGLGTAVMDRIERAGGK